MMRPMTAEEITRYTERGQAAGYPGVILDGRFFDGAEGWARLLSQGRTFMPADLMELDTQLAGAEHRQAQLKAGRMPEQKLPAVDPLIAGADPMAPVTLEALATVTETARFRRSAEGQAETQIELLEEIRDLLKEARR